MAGHFNPSKSALLKGILIVAVGLWIYWPALRGGWIWDDRTELADNALLRSPNALAQIWVSPTTPDYFPLKTTLQWVGWSLWGANPTAFHLLTLALHLVSALLFWRVLAKLGLTLAWLGGVLLVAHPLAVESVAWIAEFKNTLSLALLLVSALAFIAFDERKQEGAKSGHFYALSVVLFALALLSKSSVVMFPGSLLLFHWWKRGRISRSDLNSVVPFFALSLLTAIVAIRFEPRAVGNWPVPITSWETRFAGAGIALGFYATKTVLPTGLLLMYPHWTIDRTSPVDYLPWLALAALIAFAWTKRSTWGRGLLFGMGVFVFNLVPVLGFVPMNYQHIAWTADHLAYLSLLGSIGLAVGGLELLGKRRFIPMAAALAVLAFVVISRGLAARFVSEKELYSDTVARNPDAWMAHNNLGNVLSAERKPDAAAAEYREAIRIRPDYFQAHDNLGSALSAEGKLDEAIGEYKEAIRLNPIDSRAHFNLGIALSRANKTEEAIAQYREAARLDQHYFSALYNLGIALIADGRPAEAILPLGQASHLMPGLAEAHNGLGIALRNEGRFAEAVSEIQKATTLKPDEAGFQINLALALLGQGGRTDEAIAHVREALRLQPDNALAKQILSKIARLEP